ncbi:MAG TPA: hypothetical protein VKV33_05955, partial [Streptosporangiaceae bacterium]|nr:hypothetical protein [Streptosporangiaceae bacterium]
QVDQAPGVCVDDLCLAGPDLRDGKFRGELLGGVVTVKATGRAHVYAEDAAFPYRTWPSVSGPSGHGDGPSGHGDGRTDVTFIPYYAWANRTVGPMAVWVPMHR